MDLGQVFNAIFYVHPWHTLVIHFPIALTGTSLLFILLALWRKHERLEHAAFYMLIVTAITTVLAGLTGARDSIVRFEGGAPFIPNKIFLAVSLFILAGVTAWARHKWPGLLWKPSTMLLYIAAFVGSFALAAVLGFLGGVILYGI